MTLLQQICASAFNEDGGRTQTQPRFYDFLKFVFGHEIIILKEMCLKNLKIEFDIAITSQSRSVNNFRTTLVHIRGVGIR